MRRQMVTCVSPYSPLKTKSRRGTPILFEGRGGCMQATNWLKLVSHPLETSTLKRVQHVLYATSPPFFPSLYRLHQLLPCINVPNQIKIVFCAITEIKHRLYGYRETAGCKEKFCPACFIYFFINVKVTPATKEKRVFANVILENLSIYFQLFDVSISQWSVANNESELYRLVSMYM